MGFPGSSAGKESSCNERDLGSFPGLERFPGEGKGYPLQYSGLENSMEKESDTTEHENSMEKGLALPCTACPYRVAERRSVRSFG